MSEVTFEDEEPPTSASPVPPRRVLVYVGVVAVAACLLEAVVASRFGFTGDATFVVLCVITALTWWFEIVDVDEKVSLSLSSIILLAAVALVGPAAAGVVGAVAGVAMRGPMPLYARVYNSAMHGGAGIAAGLAFIAVGGALSSENLLGTGEIVRSVALPVLVADLAQVVVNLVLFVGIYRVMQGGPVRSVAVRLLRSSFFASFGYGVVALLLVVLWKPAGVGPASLLLVLAPLLVAQWAYLQYAEEMQARERALHVLVAAVEAKAPHLSGHSARVAALSSRMAEHLGLRTQVVADVKMAGMLHDIGQVTLPTTMVRGARPDGSTLSGTYPSRGASLMRGLSFLSGSLDAIVRHRVVLERREIGAGDIAPLVVGLADEFDLLTEVGTPDGARLTREDAIDRLRSAEPVRDSVVQALEQALTHLPSEVVTG